MNAAVGAHGHDGAQDVDAFRGADAEGEDGGDGRGGGFAQADGGFDGELVEGVEGVFDVRGLDGGEGGVDAGFDLGRGGGLVVGD